MTPMRTASASARAKRAPRPNAAVAAAGFFSIDLREDAITHPSPGVRFYGRVHCDRVASICKGSRKVNALNRRKIPSSAKRNVECPDNSAGTDRMVERFATIVLEKIGAVARLTLNR